MLHYLRAAFLAGIDVPALGRLPVNLLAIAAFVALGFLHPAFWVAGAVLEFLFLFALSGNQRFRSAVDAGDRADEGAIAEKRLQLISSLPQTEQRRFTGLLARFDRLEEIFRSEQAPDFVIDANRDVLRRLEWAYLKLLVAHANIDYVGAGCENEEALHARIAALQAESAEADPQALRDSRTATLAILNERLANIQRRALTLQEIDADLNRIEAQVDLLIENATLSRRPEVLTANPEVATNLDRATLFGDAQQTIADLDQMLAASPTHPAARVTEQA